MTNGARTIVLRNTRDERGARHLEARLEVDGRLRIEGHDIGRGVPEAWSTGSGYEWSWTIEAAEVPRLVAALGGEAGADVLELLQDPFSRNEGAGIGPFLKEHDIQADFFTWLS